MEGYFHQDDEQEAWDAAVNYILDKLNDTSLEFSRSDAEGLMDRVDVSDFMQANRERVMAEDDQQDQWKDDRAMGYYHGDNEDRAIRDLFERDQGR